MINQITNIFSLTIEEENHISNINNAAKPSEWKRGTVMMNGIRGSITSQLDSIQNQKCCYCGLQLWETGRGEIEHIAPKASRQKAYPEFTFTKQNLALSCEYCNGSSKKGETDIIFRYNAKYSDCEFKLVHPYFDNPNQHYQWINYETKIMISHKTWKGKYSIILFGLKDLASARAKQRIFEKKVNKKIIVNNLLNRFFSIINFDR